MGVQLVGTYGNPYQDLVDDNGFLVAHGKLNDEGNFEVDLDNLPPGVWIVDENEYELESPQYKFAKDLGMDVSYDPDSKSINNKIDVVHADMSEVKVTDECMEVPADSVGPRLHVVPSMDTPITRGVV